MLENIVSRRVKGKMSTLALSAEGKIASKGRSWWAVKSNCHELLIQLYHGCCSETTAAFPRPSSFSLSFWLNLYYVFSGMGSLLQQVILLFACAVSSTMFITTNVSTNDKFNNDSADCFYFLPGILSFTKPAKKKGLTKSLNVFILLPDLLQYKSCLLPFQSRTKFSFGDRRSKQ